MMIILIGYNDDCTDDNTHDLNYLYTTIIIIIIKQLSSFTFIIPTT